MKRSLWARIIGTLATVTAVVLALIQVFFWLVLRHFGGGGYLETAAIGAGPGVMALLAGSLALQLLRRDHRDHAGHSAR